MQKFISYIDNVWGAICVKFIFGRHLEKLVWGFTNVVDINFA